MGNIVNTKSTGLPAPHSVMLNSARFGFRGGSKNPHPLTYDPSCIITMHAIDMDLVTFVKSYYPRIFIDISDENECHHIANNSKLIYCTPSHWCLWD